MLTLLVTLGSLCLTAGFLINSTAGAQSPTKAQPTVPQVATAAASLPAPSRSGVSAESKSLSRATLKNAPLSTAVFIENVGQFDSKVRYQVRIGGQTAWLTTDGVVFDATRPAEGKNVAATPRRAGLEDLLGLPSMALDHAKPAQTIDRLVFTEDFVRANCCSEIEAKGPRQGVYNYFQSSDPAKWRTNVRGYGEVIYRDVWPGIDLRIYGNGSDLEQEFLVQPGGDLSRVQISYRGIDSIDVAQDGSLEVKTAFGKLRETKPRIYQQISAKQLTVDGEFKLLSKTSYSFEVGSHSLDYALVIDPTLLYSTFLGGSAGNNRYGQNNEVAAGIAVDASGNAYVAGSTTSMDFPITPGVFQPSSSLLNGMGSAFITKLDPSGSKMIYSTYLGWAVSSVKGLAVDAGGRSYVTGVTWGSYWGHWFPTTSNAFSPGCGSTDVFMTALNSTGDQLVYSTCLGTSIDSNYTYSGAIAVDSHGRAALAGTAAMTLPTTPNAYQPTFPGTGRSAYVAVFDTTASGSSSLVYATYLGPSGRDQQAAAQAVTFDTFGKIYVAGWAQDGFPTTAGAFQTLHGGCPLGSSCQDGFVAKLDPSVSGSQSLIYSTYLGGVGDDLANAIAVDSSGNAYVTGRTAGSYYGSFPITPGAFQTTAGQNGNASFVSKINAAGSGLVYSTFLSDYRSSTGYGIAVDSLGDAYITGQVNGSTFPVTPDAFQSTYIKQGNSTDYASAFLAVLHPTGSALLYSSYLGGSQDDVATGIAIDQANDVYLAGHTSSADFPVTGFSVQPVMHGTGDAFVTKFPLGASQTLSVSSLTPTSGGNSGTVSLQIFGTGFHAGAAAKLICSQSIVGVNVTVGPGGRFLNTTFDLKTAPAGKCDLVVTNPDSTSATLSQAFTIQQGGQANIHISLTGVEARRVSHNVLLGPAATLEVTTITNTGNVDSTGGYISLPLSPPFTLTSASRPGLADGSQGAADDFPFWPSGPIPAGGSQAVTATTATTVATSCGTPPLGAQACFIPDDCYVDRAKLKTCMGVALVIEAGCEAVSEACLEGVGEVSPWTFLGCLTATGACSYLNHVAIHHCLNEPGVEVCHSGAPICFSDQLPCVMPGDPNNLAGPPGVGGQRWMTGAQALSYVVSYDNEPSATAPAQQVIVTQPLGPNVNLSSLSLLGITLPNSATSVQVPIPPNSFNPAAGVDEFTTNADLRPTQSLLVSVNAKLNRITRMLTLTFTSIDPSTGLPPFNPLVGFLPAGAGANFSFSVTPSSGLPTGAQVSEQATVVFDGQAPMSTAVWTNMIDNNAPSSRVAALAAAQSTSCFKPQWSGTDTGAGIKDFTILVSDNGGPFTSWLSNTTSSSAVYNGQAGHVYSFYSQAQDQVGNIEAAKSVADAITTVGATASCNGQPSLSGAVASKSAMGTTMTVALQLTNTGAGNAQTLKVNQITFRTLSGTGAVTLAGPTLPITVGSLAAGGSTPVTLTLNVPSTIKQFSITETGTLQDVAAKTYSFSIAQVIIP
jgi:hypothetical protein